LKAQENDGLYSIKGGQEGDVLVWLYCQTLECEVKAKVMQWQRKLCIYTQHVHQNHLTTPQKGLKKPALRFVQANHENPQQHLLPDLKQRHYHNKSWTDSKNKTAIKNAKQCAKKNPIEEEGAFRNLQELRRALDAHRRQIEEFLCSIDPPPAITAGAQSTNQDMSAL
jgi:hypothetical protein